MPNNKRSENRTHFAEVRESQRDQCKIPSGPGSPFRSSRGSLDGQLVRGVKPPGKNKHGAGYTKDIFYRRCAARGGLLVELSEGCWKEQEEQIARKL